jgi:hypothetical protein
MSGRVPRPPRGQPEPPDDDGGAAAPRPGMGGYRVVCWAACALIVFLAFVGALAGAVQGGALGAASWSVGAFFLAFSVDRILRELEGPPE